MKIQRVVIDNFKSISHLEIDFFDGHTRCIRPMTAIFGDNGSGKTTVLQAIALVLSLATRNTIDVIGFKWHGFLPDRLASLGDTRIEMSVQMDDDELAAVDEVFMIWKSHRPLGHNTKRITSPNKNKNITILYFNGNVQVQGDFGNLVELWGRYYVKTSLKYNSAYRRYFERIGDVFWFDQYRNLGSGSVSADDDKNSREDRQDDTRQMEMTWHAGVEILRKYLVAWWQFRDYSSESNIDSVFIQKLEDKFGSIFKGVGFYGPEPMPSGDFNNIPQFYFMLSKDKLKYEISEMSSGEQAVFCLLYDTVRLNIAKSIVLIDEIELHLHPPEQLALYNSLKKVAPDCQFIITSHSPYLENIIPEDNKIRLKGGLLCL